MLKYHQSGASGWSSSQEDPACPPYGVPYFRGEKVSVSLGQPEPGKWGELGIDRVRLVFAFQHAWGLIQTTWDGVESGPTWLLEPNRCILISPELEMTLHLMCKTELVVLYVEPTAFGECGQLPWDFLGRDFRLLARRDPCLARLGGICLNLCRQWDRPDPEFVEGIGLALASRTLAQFRFWGESNPSMRSGLPLDLVNQVTQYVDAHLGDPIRARDLARRVGLSPDHFARRFKITARMAPKQFVLRRRMERMHELLGTGRFNVTQAGREVGFHDPSHLNRCFRNIFGYSPIVALKGALPGPGNN